MLSIFGESVKRRGYKKIKVLMEENIAKKARKLLGVLQKVL